ncbi:aspartyl/asparaginyl beta-hydroxylase domain-containing protein [Stieleria varia]|nr:aspartyl/asparaginyl beta-hydroxylase domain-containing protein [Stieleria varia]
MNIQNGRRGSARFLQSDFQDFRPVTIASIQTPLSSSFNALGHAENESSMGTLVLSRSVGQECPTYEFAKQPLVIPATPGSPPHNHLESSMPTQCPSEVPDRVRLDLSFDAGRLQDDLRKLESGDWIDHFVTQNYQGNWSVIPLRGPASATHPVMMIYSDPTCVDFADTPYLAKSDYFQQVLQSIRCPLLAVRLMKLTSGSRIKEHRDHDLDLQSGTVRLHVPVVTNPDVDFRLNGIRVKLDAGSCWYLRLSDPHCVDNRGTSDRVHMVIDARVNDWLLTKLTVKSNG